MKGMHEWFVILAAAVLFWKTKRLMVDIIAMGVIDVAVIKYFTMEWKCINGALRVCTMVVSLEKKFIQELYQRASQKIFSQIIVYGSSIILPTWKKMLV